MWWPFSKRTTLPAPVFVPAKPPMLTAAHARVLSAEGEVRKDHQQLYRLTEKIKDFAAIGYYDLTWNKYSVFYSLGELRPWVEDRLRELGYNVTTVPINTTHESGVVLKDKRYTISWDTPR